MEPSILQDGKNVEFDEQNEKENFRLIFQNRSKSFCRKIST